MLTYKNDWVMEEERTLEVIVEQLEENYFHHLSIKY